MHTDVFLLHMKQSRALHPLRTLSYIVDGECDQDFFQATKHKVSSPSYLTWTVAVMELPRRDQLVIRDFCDEERIWWWQTEGKSQYPDTSDGDHFENERTEPDLNVKHDLQEQLAHLNERTADLIRRRDASDQGDWSWLRPWGLRNVAWPFPAHLDGNEDQVTLAAEADIWESFGRSLSGFPFDGFVSTEESADAEYRAAINAWAAVIEAGQALCLLAAVLRACIHQSVTRPATSATGTLVRTCAAVAHCTRLGRRSADRHYD